MDNSAQNSQWQRIDLTQGAEVAYWCRIFDVDMAQLRDAVHHAGHQVAEVRRYLSTKIGANTQPLG
jgi:hypothetical protein